MARPARNNADYYTHSAHLRNDRRVKAIRTQLGAAGYGLLHMLLEALTDADFTQLNTEELEIELLAGDFGVSVTEIHSLLQIAEKVGFLARNEVGCLVCPDLNSWLAEVFEKRNRAKNAYKQAGKTVSVTETGVSVTETPQSKVNKSKEDNTIEAGAESELDSSTQNPPDAASPDPAEASKPSLVLGAALNVPFEEFWQAYGKKTGRHKSELKWKGLTPAERLAAIAAVPAFVASRPDPKFRKDPLSWLNGKHWQDELSTADAAAHRAQPLPQPVGPAPATQPDLNPEVVSQREAERDARAAEARRQVRARSLASS